LLNKVVDFEEIWGIRDDGGWACPIDDTDAMSLPVWPAKAFAEQCCVDIWRSHHPESIPLSDWMTKWLPGMERDKMSQYLSRPAH